MTSTLSSRSDAVFLWGAEGYSAFSSFQATTQNLTISYIRYDNTVIYEYTLTEPHYSYQEWVKNEQKEENENDGGEKEEEERTDDAETFPPTQTPHSSPSHSRPTEVFYRILTISFSLGGAVLGLFVAFTLIVYLKRRSSKTQSPAQLPISQAVKKRFPRNSRSSYEYHLTEEKERVREDGESNGESEEESDMEQGSRLIRTGFLSQSALSPTISPSLPSSLVNDRLLFNSLQSQLEISMNGHEGQGRDFIHRKAKSMPV
jgi:hypothetical protein